MDSLKDDIKRLIIATFGLEGMSPADIDSAAPLFGEGLGLDSIDALELGMALKRRYDIRIDADTPDLARRFASVDNLAEFIAEQPGVRKPA